MKVSLVRHCTTDFNTQGILRGWLNPELSVQGREEAKAILVPPGTLYCSDLLRAVQTAAYMGVAVPEFALRPWNVGQLAGRKDVHKLLATLQRLDVPPAGGERYSEFVRRFLGFVCSLKEDSVLVTHFRNLKLMQAWAAASYRGLDWRVLAADDVQTASVFPFSLILSDLEDAFNTVISLFDPVDSSR